MKLRLNYIFNYIFLTSLSLLIVNDHVLKSLYHNWLTGKLSDISGIVVLVLFACLLFGEKRKLKIYITCALAFIFWKSGYSQTLIDLWNEHMAILKMQRTIDYSDLLCLPVLAPLYFYQPKEPNLLFTKKLIAWPLMLITFVAIVATSRSRGFNGNSFYVNDVVTLKTNRQNFYQKLVTNSVDYSIDSTYVIQKDTFHRVILNNIRFGADTIYEVRVRTHEKSNQKTEIFIEYLTISSDPDARFMMAYKEYKNWMREYKVESIRYFKKIEDK